MPPKKPIKKWKPGEESYVLYLGGAKQVSEYRSESLGASFNTVEAWFFTYPAALKAAKEVKALLKKLPKE